MHCFRFREEQIGASESHAVLCNVRLATDAEVHSMIRSFFPTLITKPPVQYYIKSYLLVAAASKWPNRDLLTLLPLNLCEVLLRRLGL